MGKCRAAITLSLPRFYSPAHPLILNATATELHCRDGFIDMEEELRWYAAEVLQARVRGHLVRVRTGIGMGAGKGADAQSERQSQQGQQQRQCQKQQRHQRQRPPPPPLTQAHTQQRVFHGVHDDDITCLAVDPSGKVGTGRCACRVFVFGSFLIRCLFRSVCENV